MVWCSEMDEKKYFGVVWSFEKKKSEEFVNKAYVSETEGPRKRGRPVAGWKSRVKD